jgi:hypothetical protein
MHDAIEKAVPEGLASDLNQLWGTKDGKKILGDPATHPPPGLAGSRLINFTLHDGLTALANSGS